MWDRLDRRDDGSFRRAIARPAAGTMTPDDRLLAEIGRRFVVVTARPHINVEAGQLLIIDPVHGMAFIVDE
jgi:hypothetical protein